MDTGIYTFTISESYSLRSIPLERLAEYLSAFARLLGEQGNVHLEDVREGSVALLATVDEPARPKVRERIQSVRLGAAPPDARLAYTVIDEMLRRDNASGSLSAANNNVIVFPGKNKPEPVAFGPFKQQGTIDGTVYRIGGKDETKHIHIRSGDRDISTLVADEALALQLRHHLFGGPLRFHGTGTWLRHDDGRWELKAFKVIKFDLLDEAPLADVVKTLRQAARGDALTSADLFADWLAEREQG